MNAVYIKKKQSYPSHSHRPIQTFSQMFGIWEIVPGLQEISKPLF